MKCIWRRPAKQLWQPTISSSPVTRPNSIKPANECRKIKKSCLPFTTSRPYIGRICGPLTPSNQPSLPSGYKLATLDTRTAAPAGYLFEVVGLEKKFEDGQVQALRGVTFSVVQGEFVAIAGPSGCGKTTLLQMLGALDRPTAGTLLYRGNSIPDLPDPSIYRAHEIGFIFQAFHLLPTFTALVLK